MFYSMEQCSGGVEVLTKSQPLPGSVLSLPDVSSLDPAEMQAELDQLIWSNGDIQIQNKNPTPVLTPVTQSQTIAVSDAINAIP